MTKIIEKLLKDIPEETVRLHVILDRLDNLKTLIRPVIYKNTASRDVLIRDLCIVMNELDIILEDNLILDDGVVFKRPQE